jgi:hypothetical protein
MFRKFVLLIAFILSTFYGFALAGEKAGSLNLGRNIAQGEGSAYWNNGFTFGGNVFGHKNPHVFYGLRMAYSHRRHNLLPGSIGIFELVPSVRIISTSQSFLNIFGHFGLGYHRSEFGAGQSSSSGYWNLSDTRNTLGLSVGGGVLIGRSNKVRLEIFPLLSLLVDNDQIFNNYYTINIGFFLMDNK